MALTCFGKLAFIHVQQVACGIDLFDEVGGYSRLTSYLANGYQDNHSGAHCIRGLEHTWASHSPVTNITNKCTGIVQ